MTGYLDKDHYDRFSDDRVDYLDTDERPTVTDLVRRSFETDLLASPPFGGDQGRVSQDTGERFGPAQSFNPAKDGPGATDGPPGTPQPPTGVPLPAGVAASHRILLPDDAAAPQAAPTKPRGEHA